MKINLCAAEVISILGDHIENKMGLDKDTLEFKPIVVGARRQHISFEITVIERKHSGLAGCGPV
jgi:hypothetical protein